MCQRPSGGSDGGAKAEDHLFDEANARSGGRDSRYDRLGYAILVYLIYSNLLGVAYSLVAKEAVAPWVGFWWVHVPLAGVAMALMAWQSGWRPLRLWRRTA